jgi:methyl-CpG-binding domain protein 2
MKKKQKHLLWEKRLEGLRACDPSGEELVALDLPQGVSAVGPRITADTVLQSVATALHVTSQPVVGQTGSKVYLENNPGVFLNPEQPLIHAVAVNEDDIRVQEDRVLGARKKLEEALRTFFDECV